ncbi:MAG: hypothetical protein FJZ16_06810, partial [Candidatus Omnitrophica bacterium]|nr:hypothetical protein [Candidatus Omnitrophota bacterium]
MLTHIGKARTYYVRILRDISSHAARYGELRGDAKQALDRFLEIIEQLQGIVFERLNPNIKSAREIIIEPSVYREMMEARRKCIEEKRELCSIVIGTCSNGVLRLDKIVHEKYGDSGKELDGIPLPDTDALKGIQEAVASGRNYVIFHYHPQFPEGEIPSPARDDCWITYAIGAHIIIVSNPDFEVGAYACKDKDWHRIENIPISVEPTPIPKISALSLMAESMNQISRAIRNIDREGKLKVELREGICYIVDESENEYELPDFSKLSSKKDVGELVSYYLEDIRNWRDYVTQTKSRVSLYRTVDHGKPFHCPLTLWDPAQYTIGVAAGVIIISDGKSVLKNRMAPECGLVFGSLDGIDIHPHISVTDNLADTLRRLKEILGEYVFRRMPLVLAGFSGRGEEVFGGAKDIDDILRIFKEAGANAVKFYLLDEQVATDRLQLQGGKLSDTQNGTTIDLLAEAAAAPSVAASPEEGQGKVLDINLVAAATTKYWRKRDSTRLRDAAGLLNTFIREKADINAERVNALHKAMLGGRLHGGLYRDGITREIGIYAHWKDVPEGAEVAAKMDEFFKWLNKELRTTDDYVGTAVSAYVRLVKIHPYYLGGNDRIAWLLMNWILLKYGCPPFYVTKDNLNIYLDLGDLVMMTPSEGLSDVVKMYKRFLSQQLSPYSATASTPATAPGAATPGAPAVATTPIAESSIRDEVSAILNQPAFPDELSRRLLSNTGISAEVKRKGKKPIRIDLSWMSINAAGIAVNFIPRSEFNQKNPQPIEGQYKPYLKSIQAGIITYVLPEDITIGELAHLIEDIDVLTKDSPNRFKLSSVFSQRLKYIAIYLARKIPWDKISEPQQTLQLQRQIELIYLMGGMLEAKPDDTITKFEDVQRLDLPGHQALKDIEEYLKTGLGLTPDNLAQPEGLTTWLGSATDAIGQSVRLGRLAQLEFGVFLKGVEGLYGSLGEGYTLLQRLVRMFAGLSTQSPLPLREILRIEDYKMRLGQADPEEEIKVVDEIVSIVQRYEGWKDEEALDWATEYITWAQELNCIGRCILTARILKEIGIPEDRVYFGSFPGHGFLILELSDGSYCHIQTVKGLGKRVERLRVKDIPPHYIKDVLKEQGSVVIGLRQPLIITDTLGSLKTLSINVSSLGDGLLAAYHHNLGDALRRSIKKGMSFEDALLALDAAITEYRRALWIDRNLAHTHNDLGAALFEKGKLMKDKDSEETRQLFNSAVEEFKEALRLNPNYTLALINLELTKGWIGFMNLASALSKSSPVRIALSLLRRTPKAVEIPLNTEQGKIFSAIDKQLGPNTLTAKVLKVFVAGEGLAGIDNVTI